MFGAKIPADKQRYIRIKYWPAGERVYPTPNKLQALKPDTWGRMSGQAREVWARNQLRRVMGPKSEFLGWADSDG
jgi:hypothetical protein